MRYTHACVVSFTTLTCHVEFSLWWMTLQLKFLGELSMECYFPCQLTLNQTIRVKLCIELSGSGRHFS